MGTQLRLILLASLYIVSAKDASTYKEATVYMTAPATAKITLGVMDKQGAAYGYYNNSLLQSGWGVLEVRAGYARTLTKNNNAMFAAGYLEGYLTAKQITDNFSNLRAVMLTGPNATAFETKIKQFYDAQDAWMRNMIKQHKSDPYWRHAGYILSHLDGAVAGYAATRGMNQESARFTLQFLNGMGDILDLKKALMPETRPRFSEMTHAEVRNYIRLQGHCSAMVKVTGAFENVYMAHSTWFVYSATMRIYKHYHFNIEDTGTGSKSMSFSSYAGFLESIDDFYLMDSQLVLLQTTNNVFNTSLYSTITSKSMLAWQRVRIGNMMASTGPEWYKIFKRYNSGTYNNQYMVIDLKQISLRKEIRDNALWVVEQVPTLVVGGDQTPILRAGYWPSYNVPFYEEIYNISGYPAMVHDHGLDLSYQLAPRAKIFRRDEGNVDNMNKMQYIMRYNDYKTDPYSEGNACNSICCRGDLIKGGAVANGCYDTKVSDFNMATKLQSFAINGPTRVNHLPPFSWTGQFADVPHQGLPETYDFGWVYMQPKL